MDDKASSDITTLRKRILSLFFPEKKIFTLSALLILFGAFFAAAWAIWHPGFHSRMVYDSQVLILDNTPVFARGNPLEIINIVPQRPLFMLSLQLNYFLTGMDPFFFRLFNTAILAAAATTLALLIASILETPLLKATETNQNKRYIAVALALLFTVHPVQCFGVLYIWQREALMACFFYFAALSAYLIARIETGGRVTPAYILSSVFFFLGLLSKENLITLPIMMVVAEPILFQQNFKQTVRRICFIALLTMLPVALTIFFTHTLKNDTTSVDLQGTLARMQVYYEKAGVTPYEVVLTQTRIIFSHLSTIIMPFLHGLQLLRAETISRSLWDSPITMVTSTAVIGLLGLAVWWYKRFPLASMGILFFFISLAPESLFIPHYLYCGYRAILPMAGVLLIITQCIVSIVKNSAGRRVGLIEYSVILMLLIGVGVMSISIARSWSPEWVWKKAFDRLPPYSLNVEKNPYQEILVGYAGELERLGNLQTAMKLWTDAMEIDWNPKNDKTVLAMGNLAISLFQTGKREESLNLFKKSVAFNPRSSWLHFNFGVALINSGKKDEGAVHLRQAVDLYPTGPAMRLMLGEVLQDSGDYAGASEQYNAAIKLDPFLVKAYTNLGKLLLKIGKSSEALAGLEKAVMVLGKQADAELYNVLGIALSTSGRTEEARSAFQKALFLKPNHVEARRNLEKLFRQ